MENSNMNKAVSIYQWTIRKYLSVSIAYWVLLFLSLPVIELFLLIESVSVPEGTIRDYQKDIAEIPQIMVLFIFVAVVMSTIIAFVAFSYMHNKRCVDFFGSLPVSRRTMFFSRYMAVQTMVVVPILAFGILGAVMTWSTKGFENYMNILGLVVLAIIGNVSFIAFISLCSGTVTDMIISFLALNVAYPICIAICGAYPTIVLPGMKNVDLSAAVYTFFTPLAAPYTGAFGECKVLHCFWWCLITLTLCFGCYFLCKKRKAENAQNSFTFSVLSNTIKFIMCFAAGFGCGWILSHIGVESISLEASYIWFFVGLAIGIMVTNILLHLIFYKGLLHYAGSLKLCGSVFVVATVFLFSVTTGGFGYDEYVPDADEVEEVSLIGGQTEFYVHGKNILENYTGDEEKIKSVIALHKAAVKGKMKNKYHGVYLPVGYHYGLGKSSPYEETEDEYIHSNINIMYRLKSGDIVSRYYELDGTEQVSAEFLANQDMMANINTYSKIPGSYMEDYIDIQIKEEDEWLQNNFELSDEERNGLAEALRKDYEAVGLIQGIKYENNYYNDDEGTGSLEISGEQKIYLLNLRYRDLRDNYLTVQWAVDDTYKNTVNVLKKYDMYNLDYNLMKEYTSRETDKQLTSIDATEKIYVEVPKDWNAKQLQANLIDLSEEEVLWNFENSRTKCVHVKDNIWYIEVPQIDRYGGIMFYEVKEGSVYTTGGILISSDNNMLHIQDKLKKVSIEDTFPQEMYDYQWTSY